MATLQAVANAAGVSKGVASLVLNGRERSIAISAATKGRIIEAAARLMYMPDVRAQTLRAGRAPVYGVLLSSLAGRFRPALVSALCEEASRRGKQTLLSLHHGDAQEAARHVDVFRAHRTDGVILVTGPCEAADEAAVAALRDGSAQCGAFTRVCFGSARAGEPCVGMDRVGMFQQALRGFAAAGCGRVVLAGADSDSFKALEDDWRKAVDAAPGAPVEMLAAQGSTDQERGAYLARELRRRLGAGPLGVYASHDMLGAALLNELATMGVRSPSEVMVIGHGDEPAAALLARPAMTTFDSVAVIGEMARLVVEAHSGPEPMATPKLVLPEMAYRDSFRPAPGG